LGDELNQELGVTNKSTILRLSSWRAYKEMEHLDLSNQAKVKQQF
jgi:hypothetical protein